MTSPTPEDLRRIREVDEPQDRPPKVREPDPTREDFSRADRPRREPETPTIALTPESIVEQIAAPESEIRRSEETGAAFEITSTGRVRQILPPQGAQQGGREFTQFDIGQRVSGGRITTGFRGRFFFLPDDREAIVEEVRITGVGTQLAVGGRDLIVLPNGATIPLTVPQFQSLTDQEQRALLGGRFDEFRRLLRDRLKEEGEAETDEEADQLVDTFLIEPGPQAEIGLTEPPIPQGIPIEEVPTEAFQPVIIDPSEPLPIQLPPGFIPEPEQPTGPPIIPIPPAETVLGFVPVVGTVLSGMQVVENFEDASNFERVLGIGTVALNAVGDVVLVGRAATGTIRAIRSSRGLLTIKGSTTTGTATSAMHVRLNNPSADLVVDLTDSSNRFLMEIAEFQAFQNRVIPDPATIGAGISRQPSFRVGITTRTEIGDTGKIAEVRILLKGQSRELEIVATEGFDNATRIKAVDDIANSGFKRIVLIGKATEGIDDPIVVREFMESVQKELAKKGVKSRVRIDEITRSGVDPDSEFKVVQELVLKEDPSLPSGMFRKTFDPTGQDPQGGAFALSKVQRGGPLDPITAPQTSQIITTQPGAATRPVIIPILPVRLPVPSRPSEPAPAPEPFQEPGIFPSPDRPRFPSVQPEISAPDIAPTVLPDDVERFEIDPFRGPGGAPSPVGRPQAPSVQPGITTTTTETELPRPEDRPEPTPGFTPDLTPEPTPDVIPEPTPEPAPDLEPTPQPVPQPAPEPTPGVTTTPAPIVQPIPTIGTVEGIRPFFGTGGAPSDQPAPAPVPQAAPVPQPTPTEDPTKAPAPTPTTIARPTLTTGGVRAPLRVRRPEFQQTTPDRPTAGQALVTVAWRQQNQWIAVTAPYEVANFKFPTSTPTGSRFFNSSTDALAFVDSLVNLSPASRDFWLAFADIGEDSNISAIASQQVERTDSAAEMKSLELEGNELNASILADQERLAVPVQVELDGISRGQSPANAEKQRLESDIEIEITSMGFKPARETRPIRRPSFVFGRASQRPVIATATEVDFTDEKRKGGFSVKPSVRSDAG